ncbi:TetR family transcriptional regulator C-terminal domain-containing protein [Falsirhodobacter halotolerans]|uniref:TetR family transcriptional regulator C-terminal domain-containing protein n=1 Tax=Falsirhodobacter halotolerans TaxID=1146892 RepID=UPI001FD4F596|nr:TetR family transcriptional regulator C-terminal domain-containing protein [Falsirhodobacter halotolerans]MCJ8139170.1 TetR family transcriptional regulator C-terminal domain-containing protein [Falsirhodobacter halotolerans]
MTRRSYQRLGEDVRRNALLDATLDCLAEDGMGGASVRRIAERAGVSAGLIRHYFQSKDDMVGASYAHLMGRLTGRAADAAQGASDTPEQALARFIAANLTRPNLSVRNVSLWATFIGHIRDDVRYAEIHRESYREFLQVLEALIHPVLTAHDRPADPATCQGLAIALNGLIDGLWLEGSLGHGLYDAARLPTIALTAAEGLLRLPDTTLTRHLTR